MATSRVIFLEDDQDLREVLSDVMTGWGIEVVAVASVREFESAMSDGQHFDLAILDINLGPDAPSGIAAYRWLKDRQFAGRTVFLTGHAHSHPLVTEALRLGDAMVQAKPMSVAELRALVG